MTQYLFYHMEQLCLGTVLVLLGSYAAQGQGYYTKPQQQPYTKPAIGIQFFEGSWAQAQAYAQETNKQIFVDFYTEHCRPCERMEDVFRQADVARVYNAQFVNFKLDGNLPLEGYAMLRLSVACERYPTFAYFDHNLIPLEVVAGEQTPEAMVHYAECVAREDLCGKGTWFERGTGQSLQEYYPQDRNPMQDSASKVPDMAYEEQAPYQYSSVLPNRQNSTAEIGAGSNSQQQDSGTALESHYPLNEPFRGSNSQQLYNKTTPIVEPTNTTTVATAKYGSSQQEAAYQPMSDTYENKQDQNSPPLNPSTPNSGVRTYTPNSTPTTYTPTQVKPALNNNYNDTASPISNIAANTPSSTAAPSPSARSRPNLPEDSYIPATPIKGIKLPIARQIAPPANWEQQKAKMLPFGELSSQRFKIQRLDELQMGYDNGQLSVDELKEYTYLLKALQKPYDEAVNRTFWQAKEEEYTDLLEFAYDFLLNAETDAIAYVIVHLDSYKKYKGKTLNERMKKAIQESVSQAAQNRNAVLFNNTMELVKLAKLNDEERFIFDLQRLYYAGINDWNNYTRVVERYMTRLKVTDPSLLNEVAWMYHQYVTDVNKLKDALDWAKLAVKTVSDYEYNYTLSAVLYKLGNYEEARAIAQQAIEIAEINNADYARAERLLDKINAISR